MRRTFVFTAAVFLAVSAPAFAQSTMSPNNDAGSTAAPGAASPNAPAGGASTTPALNRPGDADVRTDNMKGGTGGKNSSSNGG